MRRISKVGDDVLDQFYYQGLLATLELNGVGNWNITCVWLSQNEMIESNKNLLDHAYATDIITIPYSSGADFIESEILLCSQEIKDNAILNKVTMESEFIRVGAHGILHLIGFNDKTDVEKKVMREKENEIIELVSRGTSD